MRLRRAVSAAGVGLALGLFLLPSLAGATGVTVTVAATSAEPKVTGDVWVLYGRAGAQRATIDGTVGGVVTGAAVELLAARFPFSAAPSVVATKPLSVTDGTAAYSFSVAPTLATRYRVAVLASTTSTTPEATSPLQTVYVSYYGSGADHDRCVGRACTLVINLTYVVPRSAVGVEKAKHQFAYLSLPASPHGRQPKATTYHLVKATTTGPKVTHATHVTFRLSISYTAPAYAYWYYWETCTRDTLGRDGLGLPGRHGCGDRALSPTAAYVG